jgi:DNA-binding XRE family transcriptional regulator
MEETPKRFKHPHIVSQETVLRASFSKQRGFATLLEPAEIGALSVPKVSRRKRASGRERCVDHSFHPASCCPPRAANTHVLSFCHFEIRAARPLPSQYPKQINTLGDHIRARRLDLNLLQRQVAAQIRVRALTITNWESNESPPETHFIIPAIIEFLGYDPLPSGSSLPERLATRRPIHRGKWPIGWGSIRTRSKAGRTDTINPPGRAWI